MLYTEPVIEVSKMMAARDTSDGSPAEMPVFVARPAGSAGLKRPGLLLLQEAFGVNDHIQDVAQRFAGMGYVVVAPDLYYRGGHWQTFRYDQLAEARPNMASLTEQKVVGDLRAALDCLAGQPDVDPARMGVIGYCMGGRFSFLTAAWFSDRVKASAVYYGGGIVMPQPSEAWPVAPVARAGQIKCPVLAFFGEKDQHIPREAVARIDEALGAAGVEHQVFYYPYADHGFFCDARPMYSARAATDAWHRTLWFFHKHLGPVPDVTWPA